jgi:2'-5' RNA ligase
MRQFLAVELPGAVRRELAAIRAERGAALAGWRFVEPAALHLTVRFLGAVDDRDDAALRVRWRAAAEAARPAAFRLEGLGTFPPRGRPRVLWVGVRETGVVGAMAELAAAIERAAVDAGFQAEPRPFHPHLTVARAARDASPRAPADDRFGPTDEVHVSELVLFRSDLHSAGARYTALERFRLEGGRSPG